MTELQPGFVVKCSSDEWALIVSHDTDSSDNQIAALVCLLDVPGPRLISACAAMARAPDQVPGIQLEYKAQPGPGFVLRVKKGWSFSEPGFLKTTFEKLVWELERLARS